MPGVLIRSARIPSVVEITAVRDGSREVRRAKFDSGNATSRDSDHTLTSVGEVFESTLYKRFSNMADEQNRAREVWNEMGRVKL